MKKFITAVPKTILLQALHELGVAMRADSLNKRLQNLPLWSWPVVADWFVIAIKYISLHL